MGRLYGHSAGGAFVLGNVPPQTQAQYERIWEQVRRGKRVLAIGSGLVFLALLVATFRDVVGWTSWLILVALLVLCGLFHVADVRMANRPPGTVEVPEDLVDDIVGMQETRDDIIAFGGERLDSAEFEQVVNAVSDSVAASVDAAGEVLACERTGDLRRADALRADIHTRLGQMAEVRRHLFDDGAYTADSQQQADPS
ncbi:hypothetical protein Val02_87850 [Virgisporangium aliadipatigenens]|uniref:Uncharacterized protein n=1 Tax=Virgisporangium aliadipatigenens TaxID=741659 RepID=A0A8J3YUG7_9ACTN|nr:hypothetical protein [Virgisporangium aliadipatigenens]GIJ51899.1 hypothetical protein Val02_87850 [Virgisporangium aliadipatigenens]